jgi:hypothetical protein
MALEKLKQIQKDPVLKRAPRAEHPDASFAHLNVLVEYVNKLEDEVDTLKAAVEALALRVEALEP